MGIKNLDKYLREKCKNYSSELPLDFFSGRKIAIDTSNIFYKYYIMCFKEVVNKTNPITEQINYEEIFQKFLFNVFNVINKFISNNVTPIFVFDGKPPPEKQITAEKRSNEKREKREKLEEFEKAFKELDPFSITADLIAEWRECCGNTGYLKHNDTLRLKSILSEMGIPTIQAIGEAERTCSMLCIDRIVSGVYSNDSDNYTYGCPIIIRQFLKNEVYDEVQKKSKIFVEVIITKQIHETLEMNKEQFTDFCILCGCDYNEKVKNLGPATVMKNLQKHKFNIEAFIDDLTPVRLETCRRLFSYSNHLDTIENIELTMEFPEKLEISEKIYNTLIISCIKKINTSLQTFAC